MALTGADLVTRIVAGDRSAEDELVDRYRRGLSVIVRQLVGSRPHVEDLTHDSLALAITKIRRGDVRDPERLSGFLCSLTRNVAIAYLRKPVQEGLANANETADVHQDALDEVLKKERASAVREVLAGMSPQRDREVLYRFYIAEEPKEAICAGLGLSALHFNRVLHRARERFRALYEDRIRRRGSASTVSLSS